MSTEGTFRFHVVPDEDGLWQRVVHLLEFGRFNAGLRFYLTEDQRAHLHPYIARLPKNSTQIRYHKLFVYAVCRTTPKDKNGLPPAGPLISFFTAAHPLPLHQTHYFEATQLSMGYPQVQPLPPVPHPDYIQGHGLPISLSLTHRVASTQELLQTVVSLIPSTLRSEATEYSDAIAFLRSIPAPLIRKLLLRYDSVFMGKSGTPPFLLELLNIWPDLRLPKHIVFHTTSPDYHTQIFLTEHSA